MDRVRKFTGMAKGTPAVVPARRDEDESLALFGEMYQHEKERDMNLLEPMFSVEFEAIQGDGRMYKLPSGKREYLLPDGEKHDYDWLKTPPATPLFPSLEMEANSSQMIFQKELLPMLQPLRTSRFSSKPDSATASTTSESPTSSSSISVTPTARPSSSSSKKKLSREAPTPSKQQDSAYRIEKKSSYTALANRQHNSIPAAPTPTATATKASKKAAPGSKSQPPNAGAKNNAARPDKAPKNVTTGTTTTAKPRPNGSSAGAAKDRKVDAGAAARRLSSCPRAATTGDDAQVTATMKGRSSRAAATGAPVATARKGAGAGAGDAATDAVLKGRRRAGEKEQRPKLGSHAKK